MKLCHRVVSDRPAPPYKAIYDSVFRASFKNKTKTVGLDDHVVVDPDHYMNEHGIKTELYYRRVLLFQFSRSFSCIFPLLHLFLKLKSTCKCTAASRSRTQ